MSDTIIGSIIGVIGAILVAIITWFLRNKSFGKIPTQIIDQHAEEYNTANADNFHIQDESGKSTIGELLKDGNDYCLFDLMYFLLITDQFPNGIWGASLELTADLYGHKFDPGSITTSTLSSIAITNYIGFRSSEPILNFREYLQTRQSDESGAFGMMRDEGTTKYPQPRILEHGRHTATALRFFLYFDGFEHYRVQKAFNYLLNNRAPNGAWVDTGIIETENTDPVTTAFVIDALERIHRYIIENNLQGKQEYIRKINDSILVGLKYIYNCELRTSEGFWIYKYKSEEEKKRVFNGVYRYTTDVLSSITLSCLRLSEYSDNLKEIIEKLIKVTERYECTLPSSPESNIPDLDPTANLAATLRYFPYKQDMINKLYPFQNGFRYLHQLFESFQLTKMIGQPCIF